MAEIIRVNVIIDKKTAIEDLSVLEEILKRVGSPVKIDINAKGGLSEAEKRVAAIDKSIDDATKGATKFGDSLLGSAKKMASWMIVGNIMNAVKNGFGDALQMIRAVDQELTMVSKVTGKSRNELKGLEQQAYKTASAYGVGADSYMAAVSDFSRAGYKDLAPQLAELQVKTQLVGDVTAETATQFLLSVDAAYKYGGSVSELTKVLDGANQIDNKYATSIQKIAEGLGIVSPVAAQAGVSIGELSSAIGTITAVTQRTGKEAATAMRALILNIVGDTKTTFEDVSGEVVSWTMGEISGMKELLNIYAKDVVEAAAATGEIINPMKAIEALSKAMKEGLLTSQEVFAMTSDIGGKLRSSQLLALVQNWDMYSSMLEDFEDAVGSADAEIANALTGWNAKVNILKNTWTDFVQKSISTDTIKWLIDAITAIIKLLGDLGSTLSLLGGWIIALKISDFIMDFKRLGEAVSFFGKGIPAVVQGLANFKRASDAAKKSGAGMGETLERMGEKGKLAGAGIAQLQIGLMAVMVVFTAASILINAHNESLRKLADAAKKSAEEGKKHISDAKKVDELVKKYKELASAEDFDQNNAKKEEAKEIQKEITDLVKDQADALDLVNGKYDEQYEKLLNISEEYRENIKGDLKAALIDAEKAIEGAFDGLPNLKLDFWNIVDIGGNEFSKTLKRGLGEIEGFAEKYKDVLEKAGKISYGAGGRAYGTGAPLPDFLQVSVTDHITGKTSGEATKQALDELVMLRNAMQEAGDEGTALYDNVVKMIDKITPLVETYKTAMSSYLENQALMDVGEALKTSAIDSEKSLETFIQRLILSKGAVGEYADMLRDAALKAYPQFAKATSEVVPEIDTEPIAQYAKAVEQAEEQYNFFTEAQKTWIATDKLVGQGIYDRIKDMDEFKDKICEDGEGVYFVVGGFDEMIKKSKEAVDSLKPVAAIDPFETLWKNAMGLGEEVDNATSALDRFNKRIAEIEDHGDVFKDYKKMYQEAMKYVEAGEFGSKVFQEYALQILGPEMIDKFGRDWEKAGKELGKDYYKGLLGGGEEDHGLGSLETFADKFKKTGGEIYDSAGNYAGSIKKIGKEIKFAITDIDAFSRAAGVSREAAVAMADSWGLYDQNFTGFTKDLVEMVDSLDGVTKSIDGTKRIYNQTALVDQLVGKGKSTREVLEVLESLKNAKDIDITWTDKLDEGTLTTYIDGLVKAKEQEDALADQIVLDINADSLTAVEKQAGTVWEKLKAFETTFTTNVVTKYTTQGTPPSATAAAASGGVLGSLGGLLKSVLAKGTRSAPGGPSLVNDGDDGPELIVQDGKAFIANGGEPAIVNLDRGAKVFTGSETKDIMKGKDISEVPAYASGIGSLGAIAGIAAGGAIFASSPSSVSGTVSTSSSKSTSSKSSGSSSSSSATAPKEDDPWDIISKYVEYEMKKLNYELKQIEIERDKLLRPLDKAIGEFNDQIAGIDKQIKAIEKERKNALKPLDAEISALEKAKDLQDEQLQLAEKQKAVEEARANFMNAQNERTVRVFNQEKQQWEWIANQKDVTTAQKAVETAEKSLEDFIEQMKINELKRQRDELDALYNDQVDLLNDQKEVIQENIEALEDEKKLIQKQYDSVIEPLREKLDEYGNAWEGIQLAISKPTEDIAAALQKLASGAIPNLESVMDNLIRMLNDLGIASGSLSSGLTPGANGVAGASSSGSGSAAGIKSSLLKYGDSGDDVKKLQQALVNAGYSVGSKGVDGKFGPDTEAAVKAFQKAYGLSVDGKAGQNTLGQLRSGGFDGGGLADGKGIMVKGIKGTEAVLDAEMTKKILQPTTNTQFENFVKSLGILFETAKSIPTTMSRMPQSETSDSHDTNYYINGVKVGQDMVHRPFDEIIGVLPLYANVGNR